MATRLDSIEFISPFTTHTINIPTTTKRFVELLDNTYINSQGSIAKCIGDYANEYIIRNVNVIITCYNLLENTVVFAIDLNSNTYLNIFNTDTLENMHIKFSDFIQIERMNNNMQKDNRKLFNNLSNFTIRVEDNGMGYQLAYIKLNFRAKGNV